MSSAIRVPLLIKLLIIGAFFLQTLEKAYGQAPGIELGSNTLALNQPFTISINYSSDQAQIINFPEIKGLSKSGTTSSTSTLITNNDIKTTQTVVQRYSARKEGTYVLKPFSVKAGGQTFRSNGATIAFSAKVSKSGQSSGGIQPYDPFEDFFGGGNSRDYADAKADAFFSLTSNKKSVYVGEEFNLKMSLFVAEDNNADIDFYELPSQLSALMKEIKPKNCWEEDFGIVEVTPGRVRIGKKDYIEYKIWQISLFPFSDQDIDFKSISLLMNQYKGGNDPFFGRLRRQRELKRFSTKPFKVEVKDLPPGPLRGQVAVGDYKLQESIARNKIKVGEGVVYEFVVKGSGNISSVGMKVPEQTPSLDIYPPSIQQRIVRERDQVFGQKAFAYLIQPRTDGKISLAGEGFRWPFFNTRTGRYDSLVSRISLVVAPNGQNESKDKQADPSLAFSDRVILLDRNEALKAVGNIVVLFMVLAMGGILLYRRK